MLWGQRQENVTVLSGSCFWLGSELHFGLRARVVDSFVSAGPVGMVQNPRVQLLQQRAATNLMQRNGTVLYNIYKNYFAAVKEPDMIDHPLPSSNLRTIGGLRTSCRST